MNESVQRQIPEICSLRGRRSKGKEKGIRVRDRISQLVRSTLTRTQRRSSPSSPCGSASSARPSGLESGTSS